MPSANRRARVQADLRAPDGLRASCAGGGNQLRSLALESEPCQITWAYQSGLAPRRKDVWAS